MPCFAWGCPPIPQQLALVSPDTSGTASSRQVGAGIVLMNEDQVAVALRSFQAFATKTRLTSVATGAVRASAIS